MLQEIVRVLNWIAINIPYEAILASGVLSGVVQLVKDKLKHLFKHYNAAILVLISVSSVALVTMDYLLSDPTYAPKFVPIYAAAIAFGTQPAYRMGKSIVGFFANQIAEANRRSEAQKSALEPLGGIPVTASAAESFSE
jgi:hypothetical protein